jgi:hypothetical protein
MKIDKAQIEELKQKHGVIYEGAVSFNDEDDKLHDVEFIYRKPRRADIEAHAKSAARNPIIANLNLIQSLIIHPEPGPVIDEMRVLSNSLALAEAGQADLGTAAEGLTKIMNSYQFTMGSIEEVNEKAAWASDVMTQAVGMGMGSMQEFISAMTPLSGAAASVGVGFDEIGSMLGYMTSTTDTAATAGTKLESFMIALQKPSDMPSSALERMGYTSGTAMLAELGLAESARIVSAAFGGNQDAITQA